MITSFFVAALNVNCLFRRPTEKSTFLHPLTFFLVAFSHFLNSNLSGATLATQCVHGYALASIGGALQENAEQWAEVAGWREGNPLPLNIAQLGTKYCSRSHNRWSTYVTSALPPPRPCPQLTKKSPTPPTPFHH